MQRMTRSSLKLLLHATLPFAFAAELSAQQSCCETVPNTALRRLGRIVVTYPEKVSAAVDILRGGEAQPIASGYGDAGFDLFPGTYEVVISGKRVAGVQVRSGHDTQIKVGVLRVTVGDDTSVELLDANSTRLTGGYGAGVYGLPIGEVSVVLGDQTQTVTIDAGQVAEL